MSGNPIQRSNNVSFKLLRKRPSQKNITSNKVFDSEDNIDETETQELRWKWANSQRHLSQESFDDPNTFAYDEVYEQLRSSERSEKNKEARKSRYLASLKARAEQRKMEQELLEERLSFRQREQEEQQGEFKDKEKFITSAYKEKMKRLKEWEQQQQQQETSDITQGGMVQADMSKFYSNLFTRNVALGSSEDEKVKSEVSAPGKVEESGKETCRYEEHEEMEQKRKKALFGEPENRPGGLFIPSVKQSVTLGTDINREELTVATPSKKNISRERKDEDSIRQARERYLARKQEKLDNREN